MKNKIFSLILAAVYFMNMNAGLVWAEQSRFAEVGKVRSSTASVLEDYHETLLYEEGAQFLRLKDLFRRVTFRRNKIPAWNVNVYDEVADNLFFTNRQGKQELTAQELAEGSGHAAPAAGKLTIVSGKTNGLNPGFVVKDSAGKTFLFKFDPVDNGEMASASESIASRLFHAIGYNVPTYHVFEFSLDQIEVSPEAKFWNEDGFKRKLSKEKVEEMLMFLYKTEDGKYRASASTYLEGEVLGPWDIDGRRRNDSNDIIPHRYLREVRALRVFASWINYYDLIDQNTLDVIENYEGKRVVKHYVIDFGSTLGSAGYSVKPEVYSHEYMFDYGDTTKAILSLGLWKKRWIKRMEENAKQEPLDPSIGYFDNRLFDAGKYKSQLPYHAFKEMTLDDAFWASKILLSFSDEDIRAVMKTGKLTSKEAETYIADTLIERRDMIAQYWMDRTVPLDDFTVTAEAGGVRIRAVDLALKHQLKKSAKYSYKVCKTDIRGETDQPSIFIPNDKISSLSNVCVCLRSLRENGKWSKRLCLKLEKNGDSLTLKEVKRQI